LSSLLIAAFMQQRLSPAEVIGREAVLLGLAHTLALIPVFLIIVPQPGSGDRAVRINPYITLIEFVFERSITPLQAFLEILAQALAATAASAMTFALLKTSTVFDPSDSSGSIVDVAVGWAFLIEVLVCVVVGWVFFQARVKNKTLLSFAYAIGITSAIVYPFIGATTHNPFRWLAACVPGGTCGNNGAWVYPVAPLVGFLVGYGMFKLTKRL